MAPVVMKGESGQHVAEKAGETERPEPPPLRRPPCDSCGEREHIQHACGANGPKRHQRARGHDGVTGRISIHARLRALDVTGPEVKASGAIVILEQLASW